MEREVVIRFATADQADRADSADPADPTDPVASGGDCGPEEVRGTVAATGEHPSRPLPFTGWLQLLGHLEVLSGTLPAESRRPDPASDRRSTSD